MALTALQIDLLRLLRLAALAAPERQVVYRSEWLGYLPFGLYQWVEAGGRDISGTFPAGWGQADLEDLEAAGLLVRVGAWRNPTDGLDVRITFAVGSHGPNG